MDDQELEQKLTALDALQSTCTGCGLCHEACATFQASGWEHESPRGRLHLAGQLLHGHIPPHAPALTTFDRCLACQACETLCPIQVPYRQVRQIVQELRSQLTPLHSSSLTRAEYRRWVTLAHRVGKLWWRHYLARKQGSWMKRYQRSLPQAPVLAVCCVQDLVHHELIEQTLAFMQAVGYPLQVDKTQPCCGALFERLIQGGSETLCYPQEQQRALKLQQRAVHAFLKWLPQTTYFLAKGCQCFVSQQTTEPCLDLYEWIEEILQQQHLKLSFSEPREVYYQPYCRQGKRREQDAVWRLLRQIEGLTLREVSQPLACCGGYCGESLLHSQHAQTLAEHQLKSLPPTATVIVTSPDCWHIVATSSTLTLLYPIQLFTQAHFIKI